MLDFIIGASYKRKEIHDAWGGQRQGGISTPKDHPVIFLFSADRGNEFGYEDGWHEDGFLHYSGEGQKGDMQEVRGNAAIINHAKNGKQLLAFQAIEDGSRKFIGPMDYVDHYYHEAKDINGSTRKAITFRLTQLKNSDTDLITAGTTPEKPTETLDVLRIKALDAANMKPDKKSSAREYYERSASVAKYVLARAAGKCELCGKDASFMRRDNTPYLEPHHILRLADEGPDHPDSIAALCPNCHREVHYGVNGEMVNKRLINMKQRTNPHSSATSRGHYNRDSYGIRENS